MKMDQTYTEGKNCSQCASPDAGNFLDRMLAAVDTQLGLCTAAQLIFDRSEALQGMSQAPEILALKGIISAIAHGAENVASELEMTDLDEALKSMREGWTA